MENTTKGYLALGVAALMGVPRVLVYVEAQRQIAEGTMRSTPEQERLFNQGTLASLIVPGLLLWYGIGALQKA